MTSQPDSSSKSDSAVASEVARVPTERAQFRSLILVNPNYFGNLKVSPFPPVLNIIGNTNFEEIGGVGFQPQFNRLDAVVFIQQPSGYGGGVCTGGTPEYDFTCRSTMVRRGRTRA